MSGSGFLHSFIWGHFFPFRPLQSVLFHAIYTCVYLYTYTLPTSIHNNILHTQNAISSHPISSSIKESRADGTCARRHTARDTNENKPLPTCSTPDRPKPTRPENQKNPRVILHLTSPDQHPARACVWDIPSKPTRGRDHVR